MMWRVICLLGLLYYGLLCRSVPNCTNRVLPNWTNRVLPNWTNRVLPNWTKRVLPNWTKRVLPNVTQTTIAIHVSTDLWTQTQKYTSVVYFSVSFASTHSQFGKIIIKNKSFCCHWGWFDSSLLRYDTASLSQHGFKFRNISMLLN